MQLANISNIWKNKGDKLDIDTYRGIFIVNTFKSILMKLIYKDKSKVIDSNTSDFQIGGRKGKNVRDHIFVVNGIVQDTLSSVKNKPINIVIANFKLCFDGLSLPLTCKELYEAECKDDKLALIFDINRKHRVAVKTSLGITERFVLNEKVLQGDVFGTVQASTQIDKFANLCLEDQKHIYMYRDLITIAPLAMCDDLLMISECGFETELAVAYLNSQANFHLLQFGISKCSKLHIGKTRQKFKCNPIFLDNWTTKETENRQTGKIELQEKFTGKMVIN